LVDLLLKLKAVTIDTLVDLEIWKLVHTPPVMQR